MSDALEPRTEPVYLYQGEDYAREIELRGAIEQAAISAGPKRLNDDDAVTVAAKAYDDYMDGARERAVVVTIQELKRGDWRAIKAKHSPRNGEPVVYTYPDGSTRSEPQPNQLDEHYGVNVDTVGADLVPLAVVDGPFTSLSEKNDFVEGLSDPHFEKIAMRALVQNTNSGPDPKVRLASLLAQTSDETSTSPQRLA